MNGYLSSLVLASALATLASLLIPQGNERNKKTVELGLALVLLLAILRPLSSLPALTPNLEGIFEGADEILSGELSVAPETQQAAEAAVARGIAGDLASRFRIPVDCLAVRAALTLQNGELCVAHLTVTVSGLGQSADLLALARYAEETYKTECEVLSDVP